MSFKRIIAIVQLTAFVCLTFSVYQLLRSSGSERLGDEHSVSAGVSKGASADAGADASADLSEIQHIFAHSKQVAQLTVGAPTLQPEYLDSQEDGLVCEDVSGRRQCQQWRNAGECTNNYYGMIHYCPKSCGHCDGLERPDGRKLHYRPSASLGYAVSPILASIVISWKPRVFLYPYFLSDMECDRLIQLGKPRLQRSETVIESLAKSQGQAAPESKIRTSSGSDFSGMAKSEPVVLAIEDRIARTVMVPVENGEPMQFLHYEPGQYYKPHPDRFSPETLKNFLPEAGNRKITVLMYLSDVEEGGETWFPDGTLADAESHLNERTCGKKEISKGFSVKPRKGWAVVFYNEKTTGETEDAARHGSCEVVKGEKYSATKWIRESVIPDRA